MNTDLDLYRVFCEVVKYKNISKTAENMYISQSAITQSIQKLENLLGGKVFFRNKTGVELTEEGKYLYDYIKDSIETITNAENIFSRYINLEKGKIRIGSGNSLLSSLIFEPLLSFIRAYPSISISINNGITNNLMQNLANGELDMVVLNLPYTSKKYSNIEIIPLKKSSFSFFASKKYLEVHPFKDFNDINDHTFILPKFPSAKYEILNDYLKKENIQLKANYEVSSSSIIKKLVLNNVGIGFTDTENLDNIINDVTIIKKLEIESSTEGIAILNKNLSNKATLELVKSIKKYYNLNNN